MRQGQVEKTASMADESQTLEPVSEAPHQSRILVRDFLARHDAEQLADASDLLISELVSNVVRHARSTVELNMHWDDDTLRVEVRDGSSILPAIVDLAGADGGYGLRIVAALARDWGVTELGEGKAVWFTLRRDAETSTS